MRERLSHRLLSRFVHSLCLDYAQQYWYIQRYRREASATEMDICSRPKARESEVLQASHLATTVVICGTIPYEHVRFTRSPPSKPVHVHLPQRASDFDLDRSKRWRFLHAPSRTPKSSNFGC